MFIRFRPKHIFLERPHYLVATNLGLLQANQTQEYSQQGPAFHWKLDLSHQLILPVYDGVRESLKGLNHKQKKALDQIKTTRARKRRAQLKTLRTQEAQQWKLCTGRTHTVMKRSSRLKRVRLNQARCPYNKKNKPAKDEPADTAAVTGKSPTTYSATELGDSDDSTSMEGYCNLLLSDEQLDVDMLDDVITSSCTCGANNRAHKRTCPMISRAQYPTGDSEAEGPCNKLCMCIQP